MTLRHHVARSLTVAILSLASVAFADGTHLVRYTFLGGLDNSFDGDGRVVHASNNGPESTAIAISPFGDRKIVTVGSFLSGAERKVVIARHNPDGSLDGTFGYGGVATFDAVPGQSERLVAVTFDTSRRILVAGSVINGNTQSPLVARLFENGTVDTKFGVGGYFLNPALWTQTWESVTDMKRASSGHLYLSGSAFGDAVILRVTASGQLDENWAAAGCAFADFGTQFDEARALVFDGDRIVVLGNASTDQVTFVGSTAYVYRLLSSGNPDLGFGGGLPVLALASSTNMAFGQGIAVDAQHRPVISGLRPIGFTLHRLSASGVSDASFGGGPVLVSTGGPSGGARVRTGSGDSVFATGWTILSGQQRVATVHYLPNGQPDPDFGANGVAITAFSGFNAAGNALALDSNGTLVVTGNLSTP